MEIKSNIVASKNEIEDYFKISLDKLKEDLTLPNPDYAAKMRFGKSRFYMKPCDSHICYLKKVGDNYIIPRYYDGEHYWDIKPSWTEGREIHSHCNISLRDYQKKFLLEENIELIDHTTGLLLEAPCGHGKCHGKGTKILMYDGSVKNVEDIKVGEYLMGDDSSPRKVLSLARGREEMFVVHQKKGEDYVVNRSHILSLQKREWGKKIKGSIQDVPLEEYLKLSATQKSYLYGYCVPIEYQEKNLRIPPYILGAWLGDGTSREVSFTCNSGDRVLIHTYLDYARSEGMRINVVHQKNNKSNLYRIVSDSHNEMGYRVNKVLDIFREYDLINNKHIPNDYLINSRHNRLELLAGLIDTDGSYSNYSLEITQKRKCLALQIRQLCWSLGFRVRMTEKIVKGVTYWRLLISGNIHEIPTRLPRKKILPRKINKDPYVNQISLESIGEGDYYGFTLDGNHRYCLQDGTVTHNTVMGIWLAYRRGVQTMILVPTYYLAKQWLSSINSFTDASSVILRSSDTEMPIDRDFTIVVMDLFSCRKLPKQLIDNVGHVILDEAHRVGAETYLPILDEIPAMYRTALTATFRRTDGVHRILKYHFGEHIRMPNRFPRPRIYAIRTGVKIEGVVSKNKKYEKFLEFLDSINYPYKETKNVVEFKPTEELRNQLEKKIKVGAITKTAYSESASCLKRGSEMSYSVVDSYLNEHSGRRKTAIRVIQKCMDAGRTVLFLSKRKDTLKALHRYFAKYNPMLIVSETNERSAEDEEYLQKSCPLIFGVTQLAKEGLDIDRLDTLIIHLPMKDTEQAVGRISRLCDGKKFPTCLYLLDNCPITYAVYNNAKKFFAVNGEFMGERDLNTMDTIL